MAPAAKVRFPSQGKGPWRTESDSPVTVIVVEFRKPASVRYVSPTPTATCATGKTIAMKLQPAGPLSAFEYQKTRKLSQATQKNAMKKSSGENHLLWSTSRPRCSG